MLNFKIIKWMGLTPMVKPTITVDLIKDNLVTKPIDYSAIAHDTTVKIGTHLTGNFNSSPVAQMVTVSHLQ